MKVIRCLLPLSPFSLWLSNCYLRRDMASMAMTIPSKFHQFQNRNFLTSGNLCNLVLTSGNSSISCRDRKQDQCARLLFSHVEGFKCLSRPISAVGSGLESSITDPEDNAITVKSAKIVVESHYDDKIQVRVELNGKETQKVFDEVLTDLARTAPPIPGFRRQKGGKTSKVPKDFLLQMLGKDRVTNFVIQEIVSSTMTDYVKEENLIVKNKKFNTIQTAKELKSVFVPGNEFGFSATLELERSEAGTTSSNSSEM